MKTAQTSPSPEISGSNQPRNNSLADCRIFGNLFTMPSGDVINLAEISFIAILNDGKLSIKFKNQSNLIIDRKTAETQALFQPEKVKNLTTPIVK